MPGVRISSTPPAFVVPEGFLFKDVERGVGAEIPFIATILKRVDRSFPYYSTEDWREYFVWLSRISYRGAARRILRHAFAKPAHSHRA